MTDEKKKPRYPSRFKKVSEHPPRKIKILGKTFQMLDETRELSKEHVVGHCFVDYSTIEYSSKYEDQQVRDTVLHEITHAIADTLGLDLKERHVHAMAAGYYQVFTENPKLVEWIMQKKFEKKVTTSKSQASEQPS